MFCPKCGEHLPDNAAFCSNCGHSTKQQAQPQQPVYQPQQPTYQPQQSAYQPQQVVQPSMKWYKFLIYFSLFAGAVINTINAIPMLAGTGYDGYADFMYSNFAGLRALDLFCGVCLLAMAAFGIYTRFRLSGYRRNGPNMLSISYAAVVVYDLIYLIGLACVLGDAFSELYNPTSLITNMAVNLVMLFANRAYFKKRAHLFVK